MSTAALSDLRPFGSTSDEFFLELRA